MADYSKNLGFCTVQEAELWAVILLLGFQLAWDKSISKVVDSRSVSEWLNGNITRNHKHAALIQNCQHLLQHNWEVLIYREENLVADFLAKKALELSSGDWGVHPLEVPTSSSGDSSPT